MQTNHYGVTVDSEVPTTGVFSMHNLEFICEDMDTKGIDVEFEAHLRECPNEDHDECWGDGESGETLIGFVFDEASGKYDIDPNAEYSAIVGDTYVQVVKSSFGIRGALCSPCYPGQVDADTEGDFLGFAVPPDVVGDSDDELKTRIFPLEEKK